MKIFGKNGIFRSFSSSLQIENEILFRSDVTILKNSILWKEWNKGSHCTIIIESYTIIQVFNSTIWYHHNQVSCLYHHKIRMCSQDIKSETDRFVALWIRCRSSNLEAWVRIRSGAQTFYFIYSLFSFNFDSSRCSHAGTKRYEFK